jgi:hypothetical protein
MRALGEFWTRGISDCPRDADVSGSLASVLDPEADLPKYSLSERAKKGILARAARSGKCLPAALERALKE